jgi:hypothetical protein
MKAEQPTLTNRLVYIAKLYNEELHLLGRPEISSVGDLAGKAVNFSDRPRALRFAKARGLTGSKREKVFQEFMRWREGAN